MINVKNKAFLFDLNGTMINDMEFHLTIQYDILNNELKAGLAWDEVRSYRYGKNDELLARIFGKDRFSERAVIAISLMKEQKYKQIYEPYLDLLPDYFHFWHQQNASSSQIFFRDVSWSNQAFRIPIVRLLRSRMFIELYQLGGC